MDTRSFRERPRLPTLHSGSRHSHPVDAASFDRNVPTHLAEALPSEHLAGPGNVLDVRKTIVIRFAVFDEWGAGNPQTGQLGESRNQEGEVVGLKRDVRIYVTDDVKRHRLYFPEAIIEAIHFGCETPFATLAPTHELDPVVPSLVISNSLRGPVSGSVANDHPSQRWMGLSDHRIKKSPNVLFFVPSGCDCHVLQHD
jgi:hypothetical protein